MGKVNIEYKIYEGMCIYIYPKQSKEATSKQEQTTPQMSEHWMKCKVL